MLDVISGGRLVAGFPVGTPMDTNFCYGQIPALTRDKYDENHRLIMRAWAEDEPFAFDGKYNQLRYVNLWPKPIQRPHPPIYIPGGGSIETWDFCIDHDYNYSFLSFGGYLAGKSLLEGYWERVAQRGVDESPYRAAFAQIICVAETDQEAEGLYAEHLLYFFNRCLHVAPNFSDPPGYRTIKTIKAGKLNQLRAENQKMFQNLTWKDLVEGGFAIAGSPEAAKSVIRSRHVPPLPSASSRAAKEAKPSATKANGCLQSTAVQIAVDASARRPSLRLVEGSGSRGRPASPREASRAARPSAQKRTPSTVFQAMDGKLCMASATKGIERRPSRQADGASPTDLAATESSAADPPSSR